MKLFTDIQNEETKEFLTNIRQYNAALALTSFGVSRESNIRNEGHGPQIFKIRGELYHRIGSLLPTDNNPRYAQHYIYDPDIALDQRMRYNTNLNQHTMRLLQDILYNNHNYVRLFRSAHQQYSDSKKSPNVL